MTGFREKDSQGRLTAASWDGPMCPACGLQFTCDENFYFDQNGYELDCDCGVKFSVRPNATWTWHSWIPTKGTEPT